MYVSDPAKCIPLNNQSYVTRSTLIQILMDEIEDCVTIHL